ncbi:transposase family protein [Hamadaea tsunoensis]|uniref:transposase family protein n=1 Tax=Hamadaea tsunoensis TaxID=53368 RepID=UPI000A04B287
MYSGKRHACGFNVQVVGSHHGTLVLTGTPQPGSMHDAKAWRESGLAQRFEGRLHADGGPGCWDREPRRLQGGDPCMGAGWTVATKAGAA